MKSCDNASVGIIIEREGRYLMLERARPPAGIAPAAGHVFDNHASYEDAAAAEVREELGLEVMSLTAVTGGWRANKCRRGPGRRGSGHEWQVFRAEVTGDVTPSAAETRGASWLALGDVRALTARTIACAHGQVDQAEFAARPGIEPVWIQWLADAGIITVSAEDLAAVDALAGRLCGSRAGCRPKDPGPGAGCLLPPAGGPARITRRAGCCACQTAALRLPVSPPGPGPC